MSKTIKADLDQVVEAIMDAHPFDYEERDCDCDYYLDETAIRTALEQFVVEEQHNTITNQKLWEMARLITHRQKEATKKQTDKVNWILLEEMWFDYLEEQLIPTTPTEGGENG